MAHVEHFKKSDVKRVVNEWTRDKRFHDKEGRIDPERTPLNYVLDSEQRFKANGRPLYKPGPKLKGTNPRTRFLQTLNCTFPRIPHSNRKDLNVISDWCVTCPQELLNDPDKVKRFFEVTYSFMQERYGMENVMPGFVHMDETTPHAHIPVIPVYDGRVNSKKLFTKKELSSFHKDLDEVMFQEFGMKGLVKNGRTKGNYTVAELKEQKRREAELVEREHELDAREKALEAREAALAALEVEHHREVQNRLERLTEAATAISDIKARTEAITEVQNVIAEMPLRYRRPLNYGLPDEEQADDSLELD